MRQWQGFLTWQLTCYSTKRRTKKNNRIETSKINSDDCEWCQKATNFSQYMIWYSFNALATNFNSISWTHNLFATMRDVHMTTNDSILFSSFFFVFLLLNSLAPCVGIQTQTQQIFILPNLSAINVDPKNSTHTIFRMNGFYLHFHFIDRMSMSRLRCDF